MASEIAGQLTTDNADKQLEQNLGTLKKSLNDAVGLKTAGMESRLTKLEVSQRKAELPPNFLGPVEPFVKSFDEHLGEMYPGMTMKDALDVHMGRAADSLSGASFTGERPSLSGMAKSMGGREAMLLGKEAHRPGFVELQKSFSNIGAKSDIEGYASMMKSILGDATNPDAPGTWYNFLEENLSSIIQRIMLSNEDATALLSIPTAITPNIVPEIPVLDSYGVGYGKHTMGFGEGKTAIFGGGQLMSRKTRTLVQRGIRAAVTEMLLANKQKLVSRNPLSLERDLRILEYNLGKNHNLLYGDSSINQDGSTVLEVDGMLNQMQDATDGYPDHVTDWDGTAFDATTNNPLNIFRDVAEKLIINGHLSGGVITGKYNVLMDYGVANNISTVVDDKQRIMVEKYEQAAMHYGQAFTGFVTDLGVFKFKRSKTLNLTANDTWTPDADVSDNAITWPAVALTAIPQATAGEKEAAGYPGKLDLPTGSYSYRVSVVNDHAESDVADAIVTTSDGTIPADVAASQAVQVSIPYDAAFAGGLVNGHTVSPARYFLLYRANAGETTDGEMSCIAKIPINGTSTTTYVDWNQKIPKTTDMFFICNNPLDISHISLTPAFEVPLHDINFGSTRQWMIMDIAGLAVWAPQRNFIVRNVPGFVAPTA